MGRLDQSILGEVHGICNDTEQLWRHKGEPLKHVSNSMANVLATGF